MRKIPLTRGAFVSVDDTDYEWLSQWKWHCASTGYAVRSKLKDEAGPATEYMHRVIVKAADGLVVDHKNHNKLDNRKLNLRLCTPSENLYNRDKTRTNVSGYKGVTWAKGKWQAQIRAGGQYLYLGRFNSPLEASLVHDAKATELHGDYVYQV